MDRWLGQRHHHRCQLRQSRQAQQYVSPCHFWTRFVLVLCQCSFWFMSLFILVLCQCSFWFSASVHFGFLPVFILVLCKCSFWFLTLPLPQTAASFWFGNSAKPCHLHADACNVGNPLGMRCLMAVVQYFSHHLRILVVVGQPNMF